MGINLKENAVEFSFVSLILQVCLVGKNDLDFNEASQNFKLA